MVATKKHVGVVIAMVMFSAPIISFGTEQAVEYRDTQNKPVEADEAQRRQWSLSNEEWSRYKTLMSGIRGSISPANISPIEVLGTHARNDQERKKYAEIWAKMRFEDAERILAFQKAYSDAFSKLYGHIQLIDVSKIKKNNGANDSQQSIGPDSRLLIFVKINQCPACKQLVQRITSDRTLVANQTDIYFIDTKPGRDEGKMMQWAVDLNINKKRLHARNITLNHEQGNLFNITKKITNPVPLLFKLDANSITAIKI